MKKNYSQSILKRTMAGLIMCAATSSFAQNLVPNPGFEIQDTCPQVSQIELAFPWNSPSIGTPDLFNNTCGSQQGSANTGIGSAGFYAYSTFANNREYLQVELLSPLVPGQSYSVSFKVKRLAFFTYAVDAIGAYFSTSEQSVSSTGVFNFVPQVANPAGNVLTGTGYTTISGSFVASGGEQFLIIGNFKNDANTTLVDVESNGNLASYYYIDNVSVTPSGVGIDELSTFSMTFYPNPSNGTITIDAEKFQSSEGLIFEVINLYGQIVHREEAAGGQKIPLDLSSLAKGTYLVKAYSNTTFLGTEKLVLR